MPDIKKIHCNTCNYETKHELLSSHDRDYHEVEEVDGQSLLGCHECWQYGFWVCRGCDTATLEEKYNSAGMYDHDGNDIYSYTHFPERSNKSKKEPKRLRLSF